MSIFIDGANLFYCQRGVLGWWIDWKRFLDFYRKTHIVQTAHYYRAFKVPPTEEERAFGIFLSTNGYNLREKMLKKVFDKYTGEESFKGNLDIELAIDALTSANRYDICLLVSGDGDFVPLVRSLTMLGKIVQVVSTPGSVALEIRQEVGLDFQDLQDIRSHIERRERPTPATERPRISATDLGAPPAVTRQPVLTYQDTLTVGQEFDATVSTLSKYGANLSNPWNAQVYLPLSGLGIEGFVEDVTELLAVGERLHVVVTEVDASRDPWAARVELSDDAARSALQRKYDATKTPPDQVPAAGEFELTINAVKQYGAFLNNPWTAKILLHVSKLGLGRYISDCTKIMNQQERVRIRIVGKEVRGSEVRLDVELCDEAYRQELLQRAEEAAKLEDSS